MKLRNICNAIAAIASLSACSKQEPVEEALAEDDPRLLRHEIMEDVGDAAKVIGDMLKGETEFDAARAQGALGTFGHAAARFGELFPAGTETGADTEAAPAIWEDRVGFEAALQDFLDATAVAINAEAQTVEDAKPVYGPIFKTCKGCHDKYRLDD